MTRFPPSARYYTRGTVDPLDSWSSRSCNLPQTYPLSSCFKTQTNLHENCIYIRILGTPDAGDRLQIARSSFILFPRLLSRHPCWSFFLTYGSHSISQLTWQQLTLSWNLKLRVGEFLHDTYTRNHLLNFLFFFFLIIIWNNFRDLSFDFFILLI